MSAARDEQRPIGVLLVVLGAVLVLAAFRFLDWYDLPSGRADTVPDATFSDLHANVDQLGGAGVAAAYFDWLAWTLLIALVFVGAAAGLPTPVRDPLRVAGFLIGLVGVAATYYALAQHSNATGGQGALHNATWGVWLTLGGFAMGAFGAASGSVRRGR